MKFFLSLFTLFSIFCTTLTNAALLNIASESVEAAAWTIVDTQSGQIIAEHNSHVQRAPASLTKMMVAYIAFQTRVNIQLNEQKLTAPLMKAMNLATVSIYQNNQLIRSLQIENDVHIEEANIFQRIMMWFSSLFSIFSSSEHSAAKLYPIDSH
ncbi:hypothetical protein [Acinetobacter baumannii]|uniref:hypothetical protein n=1 Tax=Acinetobacter baumannii TaxID=470 RepID=UPI0007E96108|nr:hypothetical protein [Acinetobacter baumannii]MBE2508072.1 hypothetical protein [Acinetobacter baumannii]MBE2519003.1 hypothetical protein [Acinetobacter baumannii]OBE64147.1 hypothetical protein A7936_11975 [Acinetobacter baumannii]HCW5138080.1 hypothetical protein [Acinetobacter baumannii]